MQQPRYGHVNCTEVEQTVRADEDALATAARGSSAWRVALGNLARSVFSRHQCTESRADLDRAIGHLQTLLPEMPKSAPDLHVVHADLATALSIRSDLRGAAGAADLAQAIALEKQVLAMFPPGTPDQALARGSLGQSLFHQYARTSRPEDLDEAARLLEEAVADLPSHLDEWVGVAYGLAIVLSTRHQHAGTNTDDLGRAIELFERLLDQPPRGADPEVLLSRVRSGLAQALSARYLRDNSAEDIARATELQHSGLRPGGRDHPVATAVGLDQEALHLYATAHRTGSLEDLDRAIRTQEAALSMLPPDNLRRSPLYANLSTCWQLRHQWTKDPDDLERSSAAARDALALPIPAGQQAVTLGTYGQSLLAQYEILRRPEGLHEAIDNLSRASDLIPPGSINSSAIRGALARGLLLRFSTTRQEPDLTRCLALAEQMVATAGTESTVNRSAAHLLLAQALGLRFLTQGRDADLGRAVTAFRAACRTGLETNPAGAFQAALEWGPLAVRRKAWAEAGEAYQHGLHALRLLARAQLLRGNKEIPLRQAQGMAAGAAYALARAGRPQEAVVALETGRALMLSEVLERDRADLEQLEALGHADLYRRYRDAATTVASLEQAAYTVAAAVVPEALGTAESSSDKIRAARAELDRVIEAVRKVPGYERFLLPSSFPDVREIARVHPLVYLAAAGPGGVALIVRADADPAVEVRWLSRLTSAALDQRIRSLAEAQRPGQAREWQTRLGATLGWLWDAVMGDVVGALAPATRGTLIPSGPLALLPLHAARALDPNRRGGWRYALDDIAWSYAPTARSLAVARGGIRPQKGTMLAVQEPRPTVQHPLPACGLEIAAVSGHFARGVVLLRHEDATRAAVLAELPRHAVQHFACHGRADPTQPLDSELIMAHDESLTLRDILATRLQAARLAVLSACDTAIPYRALPDEVVGFPTGLLQAGAAGVIATLWKVPDIGSMTLMGRFYRAWRDEGRTVAEALADAQRWVRDTTNAEKLRAFPELAAIFPRRALTPAERAEWERTRSHQHPSSWAAFVHVGA